MNVNNHVQVGIPGRGTSLKDEIERRFHLLCEQEGRRGTIGFVPVDKVRLLAVQRAYLQRRLNRLGAWSNVTAVSIGLFFHESEILDIPSRWISRPPEDGLWNQYAHAYTKLNQLLNRISVQLEEEFGGVSEQATVSGLVGKISHVNDYFPVCVSHRAFAESARIGWRGKHGLIVTPEVGPAVRFATVFIPHLLPADDRHLIGCGDCNACLEVCPILRQDKEYREKCRLRLKTLGVEDEVCGICMRVCWEAVRHRG